MTSPVIMDLFAVAVLAGFIIYGVHRGLFRALAGLLSVIVALVGAGIIASALTPYVAPMVEERVNTHIWETLGSQNEQVQMPEEPVEEDSEGLSIEGLLELLGLDSDVRDSLAVQAQEKVQDAGASIATAVVESVAESLIYAGLYLISLVVLLIVLKLVTRAMDQMFKLPGLHLVNTLGGGIAGFVEGALALFLAIWILRRFGVSFDTDAVAQTRILQFFTTNTPLSALSFLH